MSSRSLEKEESVIDVGIAALTVWAGLKGWIGPLLFWMFVGVMVFVTLRAAWRLAVYLLG